VEGRKASLFLLTFFESEVGFEKLTCKYEEGGECVNEGIQPNKYGMYLKQDVINSQKPIYDFTKDEEPDMDVIDMCTLAEIKNLAKINLSAEQKEQLTIVGFLRMSGYRGYAALYSLKQVLEIV
jgi:hypothetical protein